MSVGVVQAGAGLLLILVVPGFFLSRALFPEWRFRGPEGATHAVETAALSVVLSVSCAILVGTALLNGPGFAAGWADPSLELVLVTIAAAAAVIAFLRGAFARIAPRAPPLEPSDGEGDAWDRLREREELARQERRLRHELRVAPDAHRADELRQELDGLIARQAQLSREREDRYG